MYPCYLESDKITGIKFKMSPLTFCFMINVETETVARESTEYLLRDREPLLAPTFISNCLYDNIVDGIESNCQ